MNKDKALLRAKQIAQIIILGANRLGRKAICDQDLMPSLSIHLAAANKDIFALDPRVEEIVLFGSTAEAQLADEEKRPFEIGDVDLMMFDNGFYSNVLSLEPVEQQAPPKGKRMFSWSEELRENIETLFNEYFGLEEDQQAQEILEETPVDLHILPVSFFTDMEKRRSIAALHYDPYFFNNAFSKAMRYDGMEGRFVPVTLAYFEQKYSRSPVNIS